jgi:hypothetical protein
MERKQHREPKLLLLGLLRQRLRRGLDFSALALVITPSDTQRALGRPQHLGHGRLEHLDRLQRLALELLVLGELGEADDEVGEGALRDDDAEVIGVDFGDVVVREVDDALCSHSR